MRRSPPKKWSDDEHKNFLRGLHRFGRGRWKEVSTLIKTRTSTQVASHAQKYFLKLANEAKRVRKRNAVIFAGSYLIFFMIFMELRDRALANLLLQTMFKNKTC